MAPILFTAPPPALHPFPPPKPGASSAQQFATCQQHLNSFCEQLALSFSWPPKQPWYFRGLSPSQPWLSGREIHTQEQYSKTFNSRYAMALPNQNGCYLYRASPALPLNVTLHAPLPLHPPPALTPQVREGSPEFPTVLHATLTPQFSAGLL